MQSIGIRFMCCNDLIIVRSVWLTRNIIFFNLKWENLILIGGGVWILTYSYFSFFNSNLNPGTDRVKVLNNANFPAEFEKEMFQVYGFRNFVAVELVYCWWRWMDGEEELDGCWLSIVVEEVGNEVLENDNIVLDDNHDVGVLPWPSWKWIMNHSGWETIIWVIA